MDPDWMALVTSYLVLVESKRCRTSEFNGSSSNGDGARKLDDDVSSDGSIEPLDMSGPSTPIPWSPPTTSSIEMTRPTAWITSSVLSSLAALAHSLALLDPSSKDNANITPLATKLSPVSVVIPMENVLDNQHELLHSNELPQQTYRHRNCNCDHPRVVPDLRMNLG